jgi:hypothetical protein
VPVIDFCNFRRVQTVRIFAASEQASFPFWELHAGDFVKEYLGDLLFLCRRT